MGFGLKVGLSESESGFSDLRPQMDISIELNLNNNQPYSNQ